MDYFNQESERLRFRKLTENDIPNWVNFFENNDRLHFLGMDLSKGKEVLAEEWIRMQFKRYETQGLGHLAAEDKENGEFIGLGGILPRELEGKTEYEIAYSLLPKFWKKGYGTELAQQMKSYGIGGLEKKKKKLKNILLPQGSFHFHSLYIDNYDPLIHVAKKNGMKVLFRMEYSGMTVDIYGVELT